MTAIKVCGLTNLEDARQACHCGADLLGFIFVPSSPRHVSPEHVAEITRALRAEGCQAQFVGVFVNEAIATVQQATRLCGLNIVQLHGCELPAYASELGIPTIIARRVQGSIPWEELTRYKPWGYLLDSFSPARPGGTGQPWAWELLREGSTRPERLIVAGGLTPTNVGTMVREFKPWGVDVSSGVEAAPGYKDHVLLERFIHQVREASAV